MALRSFATTLSRTLRSESPHVRTYATAAQKAPVHPPRRSYLYHQYESIINKDRVLFIFQHNNLNVKEFTLLRQELAKLDVPVKLTVVRSGVFGAVLRQTKYANLEPLVAAGPACVLHANTESTEVLKSAMDAFAKNKKLMLLGGKVDDTLLTQADALEVVNLPPLPILQAQLAGVLEAPARKLLGTLDSPARQLHSVLDRRIE